jgi:uncharacterized protein YhbP (UPF0306 family)
MLHRTLPKKSRPLTERQDRIYSFLKGNGVGVLASIDPTGMPHATVIYHTIDQDFTMWFLTKTNTNKHANLLRDNRVMLVVFDPVSQTTAQVSGNAFEVRNGQAINDIAAAIFMTSLKTSQGGIPPIAKLNAGEYTAFKIKPEEIRMASYIRPDSGEYESIFESLESFELKV